MLVVIETHPVQYHAPVYRMMEQGFGIPVTAIYGSDFSVAGYVDAEFKAQFAWDVDLLAGYSHQILRSAQPEDRITPDKVSTPGLRDFLRTLRPKAILLVGYSPRFHQRAFWEARRSGAPILFRGETTDHASVRHPAKKLVRDAALRLLYRSCRRLLYVGQRSLAHYERLDCPSEKLIFSPYCVDTDNFKTDEISRNTLRQRTRVELGVRDKETMILFSGKLSGRKGVDILLSAIKRLPDAQRDQTVLAFLGSGELTEQLLAEAKNQPMVKAKFLGFQNQTALSRFYHAADVLVLPSVKSETWGLVVNEALHHGLPCVVSEAVGCAPDLIVQGRTGEICRSASIDSLTDSLNRSLMLIDRVEIRHFCRQQADKYSVAVAAAGIARGYREAIAPVET